MNSFLKGAKSFDRGFATGFKGFFNFFFFFVFLSVGFGFFLSFGFTSGFGFLSVTRALTCGVSSTPSPDAVRSASNSSSSSSSAAAVSSTPPGHAGLMKGTPPFSGGSPGRPGRLARLARLNMEGAGAVSSSSGVR